MRTTKVLKMVACVYTAGAIVTFGAATNHPLNPSRIGPLAAAVWWPLYWSARIQEKQHG